ncbi:MAG: hypothetical protein GF353_11765 [Candidatus Lokiarchaeota archaeon]|nr:hypothetical protein [Candidatus Lokiarchaeota archaeon]
MLQPVYRVILNLDQYHLEDIQLIRIVVFFLNLGLIIAAFLMILAVGTVVEKNLFRPIQLQ